MFNVRPDGFWPWLYPRPHADNDIDPGFRSAGGSGSPMDFLDRPNPNADRYGTLPMVQPIVGQHSPWLGLPARALDVGPDMSVPGFRVLSPEDELPGFPVGTNGSVRNDPPDDYGLASLGYDPQTSFAPIGAVVGPRRTGSYAASHFAYNPIDLPPRDFVREALDQIARIYAGVGGDRFFDQPDSNTQPVTRHGHSEASPASGEAFDPQYVGNGPGLASPTKPASQNSPFFSPQRSPSLMAAVPAMAPRPSDIDERQVLSDAVSDNGLRDGQQYAQYRSPVLVRGVTVGVDEAGRDVLIPVEPEGDRQPDPLEKLKQRGYPKPPEDPGNGSAVVSELRRQYGQHRPNYHRYEFKDPLCDLGAPGCTIEAAYDALKRHAVPGGPAPGVPVQHGQVSSISFKDAIPGGRVETLLDDDSRSIVNRTQPGHPFSDGYVQRQIVVENGKVYLRTFGEGNNITAQMAPVNTMLARPAFEESTARIRAALRPAAPERGGEKWAR
jgi:hypothetical protein